MKDNIGEAIQMIKTADTGVTGLRSMIASLSGQLTQAGAALGQSTSGTLLQAAADSYNSVIKQMNDLSQTDSTYKGVNFLQSTTTLTVDFNETSTTSITLSGFDGSTTGLSITGGAVAVGAQGNLTTANIDTTAEIAAVQTSLNDALATLQSTSAKRFR
ncbi:MAG: hypothetical protein AUJ86_10195 [Hydrogenophilaceae bacterium CG1_02_62_390]|nr:MAG: hypothetical protein AUJ86_10195 [Hydrogenophilaceae bacterium CG1_02_62_390]